MKYVRDNTRFNDQVLNVVFSGGGLGDQIARLPAVKAILNRFPHVKPLKLWVPDYFQELCTNLIEDFPRRSDVFINNFTELKKIKDSQEPAIHGVCKESTSMRQHLVLNAFSTLADIQPFNKSEMLYPEFKTGRYDITKFNLPKRFALIVVTYTAPARAIDFDAVKGVAEYLITRNVTPVYIGNKGAPISDQKFFSHYLPKDLEDRLNTLPGINLFDKTSLLEIGEMLDKAVAVVGVDNGIIHLAACTKCPTVVGYNIVLPQTRLMDRVKGETYYFTPEIDCQGCQTKMHFLYGHDFKYCVYKDYKCIQLMNAEKFIDPLKTIIDNLDKT